MNARSLWVGEGKERRGAGCGRSRTGFIRYHEYIAGREEDFTVFKSDIDGRDCGFADKGVLGQMWDGTAGGDGEVVRGGERRAVGEAKEAKTRSDGLWRRLEGAEYHSALVGRCRRPTRRSHQKLELFEN